MRVDGTIYDNSGAPNSGTHSIVVKAYDAATGGNLLWTSSTYSGVSTTNGGRFTINMDASVGSPSLIQQLAVGASNGAVWFEIVSDSNVVRPRFKAKGTTFALSAASADAIQSIAVSTAIPSTNSILSYNGSTWAPTSVGTLVSGSYVAKNGDSMSGALNVGAAITNTSLITAGTGYDIAAVNGQYKIGGSTIISVGTGFGAGNLFVGGSGASVTSGIYDSFFGGGAGAATTTGGYNSFFGTAAGQSNTTGVANTIVGIAAGQNSTTASDNSFFGKYAGQANVTGGYNTFAGSESGLSNTSSYNAFYGWSSGRSNTSGNYNSFIGSGAGYRATTGTSNTFVGGSSGYNVTTQSNNTFVGYASDDPSGTVKQGTGLGYSAVVTASSSVQLGTGTNAISNSLQFNGYNFLTDNGYATFAKVGNATAAEVNYLVGVTSAIQPQINSINSASGNYVSKSGDTMTGNLAATGLYVSNRYDQSPGGGIYFINGAGTAYTKQIEYNHNSGTLNLGVAGSTLSTPALGYISMNVSSGDGLAFNVTDGSTRTFSLRGPSSAAYFGRFAAVPSASTAGGVLSIGDGPFDGSTSGYFNGSGNGTYLAVNAASGTTANLLDLQVGGSSKISVSSSGALRAPALTSTGALAGATVNVSGLTASKLVFTDGAKNLISSTSAVSDIDLANLAGVTVSVPNALNGVTSAIQPQINTLSAAITGGVGTANAFSFTNQTSVALNAPITSNAVTLAGFTGVLYASCSGCVAILRNGIVGSTVAGFLPGDTIALRVISSPSTSTAVTASVTVGSTTSGTWSVTTGSSAATTPIAFSFLDQTGAVPGSSVMSNAVKLEGFAGSLTASCGSGCTNIAINEVWGVTSNIIAGNVIRIKQTVSGSTSTATTAVVTVGSTTSSSWSVTTSALSDPCSGSPSPGTECSDGSVYVGISPDGNVPMYTTHCDAGQTWTGSSCTGTKLNKTWNDGSSNWTTTGVTSSDTGKSNNATLVALGVSPSPAPYQAAQYCAGLSSHGHSDWYLPALNELHKLSLNYVSIGGFGSGVQYWSSTEYGNTFAYYETVSSGFQSNGGKNLGYLVRCVRR